MLPDDPLARGIPDFGRRLRAGETTARAAADAYLDRIEAVNDRLRAYCHVDRDGARAAASALDALLAAGTDLGPLMGVPVAVKDNIAVAGMPTRAGSRLDVADLIGPEGSFVRALRRAGCVILGKTETVEFAIGAAGPNYTMGTPRNPWDADTFRLASGSSSGSAVAMAAGLCGFAVGTDTGGSIRGPASFCGVFGLKPTQSLWPLDGVLPMSRTLDSLGPLTRDAGDAALVWSALTGNPPPAARPVAGLRIGIARDYFWEGVTTEVADAVEAALDALVAAGASLVPVARPELRDSDGLFQCISRTELLATLGRERFEAERACLNPDVADRISTATDIQIETYLHALWKMQDFLAVGREMFDGIDLLAGPAKRGTAPAFPDAFVSLDEDRRLAVRCAGPTRSANVFGLCATSQPIQQCGASALPIGLQLLGPASGEAGLLSAALAIERLLPPAPSVDLRWWCA